MRGIAGDPGALGRSVGIAGAGLPPGDGAEGRSIRVDYFFLPFWFSGTDTVAERVVALSQASTAW